MAAGELGSQVFVAIACFKRRLTAERTKSGIATARGKWSGRRPFDRDKVVAMLELGQARLFPTVTARQMRLSGATVYQKMAHMGVSRSA